MAANNNTQHIVWHDDVIVKQFISYAVGCMMGRYSIDKPGLILANQGDGLKEYEALVPDFRFEIDDDGIIPLMHRIPTLPTMPRCASRNGWQLCWARSGWWRTSIPLKLLLARVLMTSSLRTSGNTTRRCTRTVPSTGFSAQRRVRSSALLTCIA